MRSKPVFGDAGGAKLRGYDEGLPDRRYPALFPHDLRHRRISLLYLRGMRWARIGEQVGQRDLAVTANTYIHVLMDETEVDYAELLGDPGQA